MPPHESPGTPLASGSLPSTPGAHDVAPDACAAIQRAIDAIDDWLAGEGIPAESRGYQREYRQKLGLLRALLDMDHPVFEPQLFPGSPLGHAYPAIEEALELQPGAGREVLEDLADKGLLARELCNTVHLCPRCKRWQLNFRETCPCCGSLDLDVERLIHHFACAHVGLEAEFKQGLELVCPKCTEPLERLGQDFERPSDTYVCRDSQDLFEAPVLEGQCLVCTHVVRADELLRVPIHRFRPTERTVRAVELNRLSALELHDLLHEPDARLATRDFLEVQIERELLRLQRHGGGFTIGVLSFETAHGTCPIFREWPRAALRDLAQLLTSDLRSLDLVAKLDRSRIAILLVENIEPDEVRERLLERLEEFDFLSARGLVLTPVWRERSWSDAFAEPSDVLPFLDAEEADA